MILMLLPYVLRQARRCEEVVGCVHSVIQRSSRQGAERVRGHSGRRGGLTLGRSVRLAARPAAAAAE